MFIDCPQITKKNVSVQWLALILRIRKATVSKKAGLTLNTLKEANRAFLLSLRTYTEIIS